MLLTANVPTFVQPNLSYVGFRNQVDLMHNPSLKHCRKPRTITSSGKASHSKAASHLPISVLWHWPLETLDALLWASVHNSCFSCDHLPQRAWWFPWAWLKQEELVQAHSSNTTCLAQDSHPTGSAHLSTAVLALPPHTYGQSFLPLPAGAASSSFPDTAAWGRWALRKKLEPLSPWEQPTSHSSPSHSEQYWAKSSKRPARVVCSPPFARRPAWTHYPMAAATTGTSNYHLSKALQKHLLKECKQSFNFWKTIWKYHWG